MREFIDTLRLSKYIAELDETARRAGIEIELSILPLLIVHETTLAESSILLF